MNKWYTQDEVAEILGVSKQTVYLYAKKGLIKRIPDPYRVYPYARYEREEVDRLAEKREFSGYSPSQVAKKLGISKQTIYRFINEGLIEYRKVPFGTKRTRYSITEKGLKQAQKIIERNKRYGVYKYEYYDSRLNIALFQKFSSDTIKDARLIKNQENEWQFYVPETGETFSYQEGIEKHQLKSAYSINQKRMPNNGYAQLAFPKEFRYLYRVIDYFYQTWGVENIRIREEERRIRLFVKSGRKTFDESIPFDELKPFITDGEILIVEGRIIVQSAYQKTSLNLPVSMLNKLSTLAKRQGISRNQLIEDILDDYLLEIDEEIE